MKKAAVVIIYCATVLIQASCAGAHTSVGGTSDSTGMRLNCIGDCVAWDVAEDVVDIASSTAAAATKWISLPKGEKPNEDQVARCTQFSKQMADVCGPFLERAVKVNK